MAADTEYGTVVTRFGCPSAVNSLDDPAQIDGRELQALWDGPDLWAAAAQYGSIAGYKRCRSITTRPETPAFTPGYQL